MDISQRLRSLKFDPTEAENAIRGIAIPQYLGRKVARLCVIHGIRYHEQYAQQSDFKELRQYLPEVSRALNSRAIMSNTVPDMPSAHDRPYCIWHPTTALEDTYRKLVLQYPEMAYQVARACAVAGYTALYQELDILPDVSVAEEARACGSTAIFELIMRQPVRYRVMDDYTRTISPADPQPSLLNDDAALLASLSIKQAFRCPRGFEDEPLSPEIIGGPVDESDVSEEDMFDPDSGFETRLFDITEDMNIDEISSDEDENINYLTKFLAAPLPSDLPPGNKDLLILLAAYEGNIDRYARLRRPRMIAREGGCVVRGIYHNPLFATWWSEQAVPEGKHQKVITQAIHARMIMSNDLSRLVDGKQVMPSSHLPYMIWCPTLATSETYRALASFVPEMRPAVLHAAVFARDRELFDWLLDHLEVSPTEYAFHEARRQNTDDAQSYFARRLLTRGKDLGLDLVRAAEKAQSSWKIACAEATSHLRSDNWLSRELTPSDIVSAFQDPGIYNGLWVDGSAAELFTSAPKEWRPTDLPQAELDYENLLGQGGE